MWVKTNEGYINLDAYHSIEIEDGELVMHRTDGSIRKFRAARADAKIILKTLDESIDPRRKSIPLHLR